MASSSAVRQKTSPILESTLGAPAVRDAEAIGRANRSAALRAVRLHGPLSRRQLTELTGLGSATAFSIVEELLTVGLLRRHGVGGSDGGRKPILYALNPGAFHAMGVQLDGVGTMRSVLTDLEGRVLARIIQDIPIDATPDLVAAMVNGSIDEAARQAGIGRERIRGLGMALAGNIDIENGVVIQDGQRIWHNVPLADILTAATRLPTSVIHHSDAIPLGEKWCGAGRGLDTFVCITVGTGVGVGMILEGRLYSGPTHRAVRRLGHVAVSDNGPLCWCGKHGCLQLYAGGLAIAQRATEGLRLGAQSSILSLVDGRLEKITAAIVAQAAADGDPYATQIIQDAGRYLGIAVAWLIHIVNPQAVLVGGNVAPAQSVIVDAIKGSVAARAMADVAGNVPIMCVGLGMDSTAVGAAVFVLEKALTF